jgi:uncharacterized protein
LTNYSIITKLIRYSLTFAAKLQPYLNRMIRTYLKYRPAWIQFLIFLGLMAGVFIVINLFATPIMQNAFGISTNDVLNFAKGDFTHPNARIFLIMSQTVMVCGLFIIPAYLFGYFADPQPSHYLGVAQIPRYLFILFIIPLVLLGIPAQGVLGILNQQIPLPASFLKDEAINNAAIKVLAQSTNITDLILSIIVIGLFAAIGEELFFRAILQRIVIHWVKNPWVGIIVTAILFSAFHNQFSGFLPRFGLGVILGAVYWYSGSLWPAILYHFLHNTIGVIIAYYRPNSINKEDVVAGSYTSALLFGTLCIALIVFIIMKMKKHSTTTYANVYPKEPNFFD